MIDAIQGPGQLVRLTVPARANSTTRTCSGSRDRELKIQMTTAKLVMSMMVVIGIIIIVITSDASMNYIALHTLIQVL